MKRRQFLKCGLLGAAALAMPVPVFANRALSLKAVHRTIDINGKPASVLGLLNGERQGLILDEGQEFNVAFKNQLHEPTIIHWHGLTPPWESDGVADVPMPMVPAGGDRGYLFPIQNTGTHWMHAHTLQEQALLAAPLIIRSKADKARDEQDVVILLHDFSFTLAEELLAGLRQGGGHGAAQSMPGHDMKAMGHGAMPPAQPAAGGHGGHGMAQPMQGHDMQAMDHGAMGMDINDIEYDAYLANDRTLSDPEVVAVEKGGRLRLRIINGAAATGFTIDLGTLEGELIAVDGQELAQPVTGKSFPLAMGQRADIRLQLPKENRAFPIFALREGARQRTGIILQPQGANVVKLPGEADKIAPVLDMALEAQLRALTPMAQKTADRHFDVALNGTMEGYTWTMDSAQPLAVRKGERVEVTMRNPSMMSHPMHLHGHHFQVVAIDGKRFSGAQRDTVNIAPGRSVTIAFDANNPGKWAFHCHHLYHMVTGMMTFVTYEG